MMTEEDERHVFDLPPDTARGKVLLEAKGLTEGDRNRQHGDPYYNLARSAKALNAIFDTNFDAADVGIIYTILKIVRRYAGDPSNRDTYVDACAYMAMAWECQETIDAGFGPTGEDPVGLEAMIRTEDPETDEVLERFGLADFAGDNSMSRFDMAAHMLEREGKEQNSRTAMSLMGQPATQRDDNKPLGPIPDKAWIDPATVNTPEDRRGIDLGIQRREGYATAYQLDRRHDDPGAKNGSTSVESPDTSGRKVPRRPTPEYIPAIRREPVR